MARSGGRGKSEIPKSCLLTPVAFAPTGVFGYLLKRARNKPAILLFQNLQHTPNCMELNSLYWSIVYFSSVVPLFQTTEKSIIYYNNISNSN